MRLLRFAMLAALVTIPVLVAGGPATYAAQSALAAPAAAAAGGSGGSTALATPSSATPGTAVTFTAECSPAANAGGASAVLIGTTLGLPEQIPMNADSDGSFTFHITVNLPSSIRPGRYHPDIDCPGGSATTAALRVVTFPHGGAATGDGTTSTTPDNGLAVAGLALAAAGALAAGVTGGMARRRRVARQRG
jgi:hypothetical protein